MASSSSPPLSKTATDQNPAEEDLPPTCLIWRPGMDFAVPPKVFDRMCQDNPDLAKPLTQEEFRDFILSNAPVPVSDAYPIPPAGYGPKFDVTKRVQELHKYLSENTYPHQRKNIMAAIDMYNRNELPRPDTHRVYFRDGKLLYHLGGTNPLQPEHVWIEGYECQYMQAIGHRQQPRQLQSTVFGHNQALGGPEIVLDVMIPPEHGGNGRSLPIQVLNDTGSTIMTLFYNEAFFLGWQRALLPPQVQPIASPDGVTLRESITVLARVRDYYGNPLTGWFEERVVLRNYTGAEIHLSGSGVRRQLYFGAAPRLSNLYVARTKTALSQVLPSANQLPP